MTRRDRRREEDLEARWTAAGATDEERTALTDSVARERELDSGRTRIVGTWRSAHTRALATRRERKAQLRIALGGGLVGAAATALVMLFFGTARPPVAPETPVVVAAQPAAEPTPEPQVEARVGAERAAPEVQLAAEPSATAPSTAVSTWTAPERRSLRGGRVELARGTVLQELTPGSFRLDSGAIRVDLTALPAGAQPVHIRAGDLELETPAAVFAVRVDGGHGSVRVFDGEVRVLSGSSSAQVVDEGAGVVPASTPWAAPETEAHRVWAESVAEERARSKVPAAAVSEVRPARASREPKVRRAAVSEAAKPSVRVEASRAVEPGSRPSALASARAAVVAEGAREETPAIPAIPADRPRIDRTIPSERAEGSVRSTTTERARSPRGIDVVEVRGVAKEELLAYRTALRQLRSGEAKSAAGSFADYLARFPKGALREEAELSRFEALSAVGDRAALARESTAWLAAHPGHPRAAEVRALVIATHE